MNQGLNQPSISVDSHHRLDREEDTLAAINGVGDLILLSEKTPGQTE